jgi:delta8-fatty-acid desaturase
VCNSIENDPDIQHLPLFAVDKGMFSTYFSTYHQQLVNMDTLARWLVSYQHWLYYPAMFCARVNLYVQSYRLLISREQTQYRRLELAMLLGFAVWFSTLLLTCLSSWPERLLYFALSHGLAGILHVQITVSHFAEDCYHGQAYNTEADEWFKMQLRGTMNVKCSRWMDWFHGGLQFQIEHHLFPRLPRHNLRECRELVKALCAKHGIPYNELSFLQGNLRVLRKMKATALIARTLTCGNAGLYSSGLYEGMNAIG